MELVVVVEGKFVLVCSLLPELLLLHKLDISASASGTGEVESGVVLIRMRRNQTRRNRATDELIER